jgi:hypothetical protein
MSATHVNSKGMVKNIMYEDLARNLFFLEGSYQGAD